MTSTLTIVSDSAAGQHYELTLELTANDAGVFRLESWHSNKDYRRDEASKDVTMKVFDIRADKARRIVFKGNLLGSTPLITCMPKEAEPGTQPFVRVVIADTFAGLGDGTNDFTLSSHFYEELKQFILNAGFPKIT